MRAQTIAKVVLAFFVVLGTINACFADSINWQPYSSAAFAKAKKEHRHVLLFGKANWCPWCRRMKNETFSNSTVISLINKNFVPVMIDIDDQSSVADRYDISVVPASIILTGDYKVVASKTGYLSASEMSTFLRNNS